MKNTLPLLFLLCFLVQSCNNNKNNNDSGVVIPNAYKKVARLEENLTMVGEILSIDFVNGKIIYSLITVEEGDDYHYELIRYSFDK